jgi:peptide/nickel transport system permease protein
MLAEGREYLLQAPHLALVPGLAIMFMVIVFNLLGDALRQRQEHHG